MRKLIPAIIFLLIMLTGAFITLLNADKIDSEPEPQIIKVTATAFNIYGHDPNGIDYGPGYVIISTESEIPLYSLLDIDIYGPCQAVGVSPYLTKDEVKLWYNGTSKVTMFGTQTAYVRVLEKGDRPCQLNE
jgi:3D (Asp-Asp-Asp) domain-containing protein